MMVECHLLYVDEIKGLYLVSVRAVTEQEYANETKIQKSLAEIPGASWFRGVLCMHLWFLSPTENAPCPVLTGEGSFQVFQVVENTYGTDYGLDWSLSF